MKHPLLLIIERNSFTVDYMSQALKQFYNHEIRIHSAATINQAKSVLEKYTYDLILFELRHNEFNTLPHLFDTMKTTHNRNTPLLTMIDDSTWTLDRNSSTLKISDYLLKPFNALELTQKVSEIIEKTSIQEHLPLPGINPSSPSQRGKNA
ncbi:response regulator [bacterium]|nr:response regulator [bacterium]